jgi:hypothetical protein
MRKTAPRTVWAMALLAAALFVGCGGEDEPETAPAPAAATPTATPSAAAEGETTETPTVDVTPAPGEEAEEGEELGSGEGSAGGYPFRLVVTQLQRTGDTVELGARMELLSDEPDASIQISSTFNDGQFNKLDDAQQTETAAVFDGVALIDPVGRKKYLVARDETGRCVCSTDLDAVFLYKDAPVTLQATLSAPPPDVTTVNVYVPGVKTFADVPISG